MDKQIKIKFTVSEKQYKDYESILEDFLNQLQEVFIHNVEVKEIDIDNLPF